MLKQKEILEAVIALIKSEYSYKIYASEVKKNYEQPCFFIKLVKSKQTQTKNFNSNSLSVILTYFASKEKDKELEYLNVIDGIAQLFGIGFHAGKRYLHVESVSDERIGEDQDILQISIDMPYFDTTGYDHDAGYDKIQTVNLSVRTNQPIRRVIKQ